MKKLLLTGIAALLLATGTAHAEYDPLPPGFYGDWCVSQDKDGTYVAHRKEMVGPCKKTLSLKKSGFRKDEKRCMYDGAMRTILHTQLIPKLADPDSCCAPHHRDIYCKNVWWSNGM